MSLLHIGGGSGSSVVAPEGVDFDGVSDYLSRSTDLVGNVDSKTFTFSCWFYLTSDTAGKRFINIRTSGGNDRLYIGNQGTYWDIIYPLITAYNSSGTSVLNISQPAAANMYRSSNTWNHFLFSCDLSDTSKRHYYLNDVLVPATYSTYTNDFIDFTETLMSIAGLTTSAAGRLKGRLSNIFLDYTYRDLSIEANRRLFITADGKPA